MIKTTNGATGAAAAPNADKNKDWQLELLMEKLRSKASQYKSFQETSKTVRMTMLDKRYSLDSVEKSQHQKCLDTLQHCIKVTSLQSMVERLESLTRQLGLKFMVGPSGVELFISSDMFYLEIILDQTGAVRDVKVHHEGKMEQQSCAELVSCLSRQDFADFTAQLEGFASIYQLNAEKKIKCKAFTALQSLESDLSTLAQLQTFMKEPFNLLHKSPVGILEKRRGGHPMKLTYFLSPYDLLDVEKGELEPITIEAVTGRNLGYSVTVCMEGSAAHKLQTTTLITVNRNINGKSTPSFAALNNQNSAVIPACFLLRLNKPMPMCVALVRQIQQLTELECAEMSSTHPLLSLIATHASDGKLETGSNKGLFVTLPDQHHCYFMTESKNMEGTLVHSIPFTHPGHVSQILVILRQQALFNTIITSCVRPNSKQDFENMIMFEISALSWTHVSISLEHPLEETMATAEIDLSDISNLQCRIHSPGTPLPPNSPDIATETATRILNRCLSVPVTMRSIIKLWDKQAVRKNHFNGHENFNPPLGSGDPGGHHKGPPGSGAGLADFDAKPKQEPPGNGINLSMMSSHHSHQGVFLNESMMASANFSSFPAADTPMLTSVELTNILAGTTGQQQNPDRPPSKRQQQHKRNKITGEEWRGTKRKPSTGEDSELLLLETSSSDSTSRSTPSSQEAPSEVGMMTMTPSLGVGFQSDLELEGAAELLIGEKGMPEYDNIDDLGDVEEILAVATTTATSSSSSKEHKSRKKSSPPSSGNVLDLGECKGALVPPSVSITPISAAQTYNSMGGMGMERRPGIEIIPIATAAPPASLPSSITITPISASQVKSMEERSRERKGGKSRSSSEEKGGRPEKKRKRKRDESPMGPPGKVPPKQDPLSKPVSVSIIKPAAESPPPLHPSIPPTSPSSMVRKFSSSPTAQTKTTFSVSGGGKLSPSLMLKSSGGLKLGQSPKHSASSPKHSAVSSPKSHHGTTTGKPSMSALKNAANSPSSKSTGSGSDSKKSSGKDGSRDKDKKSSFSVSNSNKVKSSSVKLKQLDLASSATTVPDLHITPANHIENLPSPGGGAGTGTAASSDPVKSSSNNPAQVRNRKGSLSAVIDKLKSAQHCDNNATDLSNKARGDRSGLIINKTSSSSDGSSGKSGGGGSKTGSGVEPKNSSSEYMVKPSSDGIKLTINKTRTKDGSKSSSSLKSQSSSGTGSPKTHTGLKPGVNSGPASKKPQQTVQKSVSGPNMTNSASPTVSNYSFKSSSGGKSLNNSKGLLGSKSALTTKLSPKSAADLLNRNKDRPRLNKSSSEKSIFSSSRERKSSPTQNRIEESDSEKAFKLALSKMDPYSTAPLMAEGLIKQLDKNFQIPKLSARNSDDKKQSSNKVMPTATDSLNNIGRTLDAKLYDMMSKNDASPLSKYPMALPTTTAMFEAKIRNSMNVTAPNVPSPLILTATTTTMTTGTSSPKPGVVNSQHRDIANEYDSLENDRRKDSPQNLSMGAGKEHGFPMSTAVKSTSSTTSDLSTKSVDLTSKFAASAASSATIVIDNNKKDSKLFHGVGGGGGGGGGIKEVTDVLLDFSSSSGKIDGINKSSGLSSGRDIGSIIPPPPPLGPCPAYTPSSSVSVHIVKSPARSPHSASPCITDDELMDEALVGLGK